MSYNGHVRETSKPRTVVGVHSYPQQLPFIPGQIRGTHMTTPAAQSSDFIPPNFRGRNDPHPPVSVGVPHHPAPSYDEQQNAESYCSPPQVSTNAPTQPPTSIRGPTVKHTSPLPVSSPAANTLRGGPILSRSRTHPTTRPPINHNN